MAPDMIGPFHLPSSITQSWHSMPADASLNSTGSQDLDRSLEEMEKRMIVQALNKSRGVQKQAAALLGIKERSLWHRLKKYNIDAASFKIS